MISHKVLSSAAVLALVLAMAAPGAGFAQRVRGGGSVGGVHVGGGGAPAARFGGGGGVPGGFHPGGGWQGGGGWHGGFHHGNGFIPGAIAGAVIGGAIVGAPYGYYGGPGYYYGPGYDPGYYDDEYYDQGPVVAAPAPGGDAVAYCMQTYRSYDPRSGTYLGLDGYRHPCP
jgi:hypothetical protein